MIRETYERLVGGVVLVLGAVFLVYAFAGEGVSGASGYTVTARFKQVDGVTNGSEVRLSGITVGEVTGLVFDTAARRAVLTMTIDEDILLPLDTSASIVQNSLLSQKYVKLDVGAEEEMIEPGGAIRFVQDSVIMLDILERLVREAEARRGH